MAFFGLMIVGVTLIFPASVSARESKQEAQCFSKAMTQPQIDSCAYAQEKRSDAARKRIYMEIIGYAKYIPGALRSVEASEVAWREYERTYITALYPKPAYLYGSIHPADEALAISDLTEEHIVDLRHLLKQYEGVPCPACN